MLTQTPGNQSWAKVWPNIDTSDENSLVISLTFTRQVTFGDAVSSRHYWGHWCHPQLKHLWHNLENSRHWFGLVYHSCKSPFKNIRCWRRSRWEILPRLEKGSCQTLCPVSCLAVTVLSGLCWFSSEVVWRFSSVKINMLHWLPVSIEKTSTRRLTSHFGFM